MCLNTDHHFHFCHSGSLSRWQSRCRADMKHLSHLRLTTLECFNVKCLQVYRFILWKHLNPDSIISLVLTCEGFQISWSWFSVSPARVFYFYCLFSVWPEQINPNKSSLFIYCMWTENHPGDSTLQQYFLRLISWYIWMLRLDDKMKYLNTSDPILAYWYIDQYQSL